MRAGCFAEKRVIDLINSRFVPFFFKQPLQRADGHTQRTILSALLCFGGGVLFAVSLLHLLGEVIM